MTFDTDSLFQKDNVTLKILEESHINPLTELASDKKIWEHAPEAFYEPTVFREKWFNKAIAQTNRKERIGFIVLLDNKIVGSSSFYDIDTDNKKLKIGYTWFHSSFWGTNLNAISKLILVDHVFNNLMFNRVEFCVDSINLRSCNALHKLGIKQEGVLRNYLILPNGRIRHSIIFSIIPEEWPEIKNHIEKKLNNHNSTLKEKKSKYYDLTANISEKIVVFPGDPQFKSEKIYSLDDGSSFHLNKIDLGNHTGTHIDFPAHVIKNGKTSNDYPLESLIGHGLILEVPDDAESITKKFVENQPILQNDFIFFKTSNSNISKDANFTEKYVYIEPDAAYALLKKGVRIVGIDYISVDKYEAEDLPVHKVLLSNDILIIEGLELNNTPTGRCKIHIMPLKINNMDGLPARIIAEF
ncbi:MAG: GNAT family N-acetyltransferase [Gammaproteobacteria bacterium]|nr:GNAT family N-acetyltransferase [Gammaproteobacteria bacterium]